jgi:hypothetical protein
MTSHAATIIDFGAYRERKGPAISALGLRRSEAMPNFAFMIIPVPIPMFWYDFWLASLSPCRKAAQ